MDLHVGEWTSSNKVQRSFEQNQLFADKLWVDGKIESKETMQ